ncbi:MAG: hypothetical protein RMM53_08825 [Bacteroidia bacterium]|nr:hypothetical protein [Bacteroidia bacterium]
MRAVWALGIVAAACSSQPQTSPLRRIYTTALERSTDFTYRKSVGATQNPPARPTESIVVARPDDFLDDFPLDEAYFYDSPLNRGCFSLNVRGDTIEATVSNECRARTPLRRQTAVLRGDTPLFLDLDAFHDNELYEIEVRAHVEFDDRGKYRRHRLEKNYRLKWLNLRFGAVLTGERVDHPGR